MGQPETQTNEQKTSLIQELRRRQVFKAAGIYAGSAWLITEILLNVIVRLPLEDNLRQLLRIGLIVVFVSAFPPMMLLAWFWDWIRGGVKREQRWQSASRTSVTLALVLLVVGTGSLLVALLWVAGIGRQPESYAVLPCRYLGAPDHAYHASAVPREMHYQLSHLGNIHLIAWSSAIAAADVEQGNLADWLAADFLLECRFQLDTNAARLSLRLYDTDKESDIWSTQIETTAKSVFELPERAVRLLSEQILTLSFATIQRRAGAMTPVKEAWDSFAKAMALVDSDNVADLEEALVLMNETVKNDAEFARAYAWIARLHWELAQNFKRYGISEIDKRSRLAAAEANASKALVYRPGLADALAMQRVLAAEKELKPGDIDDQNRQHEEIMKLRPGFAEELAWWVAFLDEQGFAEQAADTATELAMLDPEGVMAKRYGIQ